MGGSNALGDEAIENFYQKLEEALYDEQCIFGRAHVTGDEFLLFFFASDDNEATEFLSRVSDRFEGTHTEERIRDLQELSFAAAGTKFDLE